ncbi:hexosaminidase D-like [Corticium candelabrum]|uniref:hexosaminidase D-like n=1 Tax=Corticium candelabrum TaxID=121492 RepID=UPI002E272844|nr:hexosaminidase D-like [Corticium candelabrum]
MRAAAAVAIFVLVVGLIVVWSLLRLQSPVGVRHLASVTLTDGGEKKQKQVSSDVTSKHFRHRLVHIDLKGAPPKMSYLLQLLPHFKQLGASGLLVEYEDMYPYEGELKVLQRKEAYKKEEVLEFIQRASALGLDIVPLVPTFGHLEFVLKQSKFKSIRALPDDLSALSATNKDSLDVVKKLIEDVMRLHPRSKWIHLGGDEVDNLRRSKSDVQSKLGKDDLYLRHMKPVLEFVRERFNGIRSIIWHDMLVDWSVSSLSELASLAEPMLWEYRPHADMFMVDEMLRRFSSAFPRIWAASAFKGASGQLTDFVPITERIQNHVSWMRILQKFPGPGQLVGIALTGWSRYDHFATFCELLPAGIPSLGICLKTLEFGYLSNFAHKDISEQLGMDYLVPLDAADALQFQDNAVKSGSAFPGSEIYYLSIRLLRAQKQMNHGVNIDQGWSSLWNVQHKFVSTGKLQRGKTVLNSVLKTYDGIEEGVVKILKKYFDDTTAKEFQASKVTASKEKISFIISNVDKKIAEWKKIKLYVLTFRTQRSPH